MLSWSKLLTSSTTKKINTSCRDKKVTSIFFQLAPLILWDHYLASRLLEKEMIQIASMLTWWVGWRTEAPMQWPNHKWSKIPWRPKTAAAHLASHLPPQADERCHQYIVQKQCPGQHRNQWPPNQCETCSNCRECRDPNGALICECNLWCHQSSCSQCSCSSCICAWCCHGGNTWCWHESAQQCTAGKHQKHQSAQRNEEPFFKWCSQNIHN